MAKIHWSFYLVMGAGVLFVSYRLNSQTNSRDFTLFIWLGYLFLAIGTAKLAIWFINKRRESPKERKEIRNYAYQKQRTAMRYCPRCGNALQRYENFCPMCGQRLR